MWILYSTPTPYFKLEVHTLQVLLLWEPERMDGRKEEKEELDQSLCTKKQTVDLKLDIFFYGNYRHKIWREKNKYI